jgi:very-short-patch-repair endonuclease
MPHIARTAKCLHCKQTFTYHRTRKRIQMFCSRDCYMKNRLTHAFVPCKHCGKAIKKKDGRLYCSDECLNIHVYGLPVYKTCEQCGTRFKTHRSCVGKYCSYACKYKSDEIKITIHCKACGRAVTGPPRRTKKQLYCSPACARKVRHETMPEKRVKLALQRIGLPFIPQHQVGIYTVDFFLPLLNIALEVDGSYWHQTERIKQKDATRDETLKALGITTIRLAFESTKKFLRSDIESMIGAALMP